MKLLLCCSEKEILLSVLSKEGNNINYVINLFLTFFLKIHQQEKYDSNTS